MARDQDRKCYHATESALEMGLQESLLHYRILSKLGEGGMGVVYRARDTRLDRLVAIKVLPPQAMADADRKRRFVQEAKAASTLNHPNIVHIYDIDTHEDNGSAIDFIAMEYIEGKTIADRIPPGGMSVKDAVACAIQVAGGLAAAHAAGVVHRDLKPRNIMMNNKGLIKILDFGLAKLIQPSTGDSSTCTETMHPSTAQGVIVGTAAYMSPEQAEGKTVDARSDIFSFGAVLYQMLTGQQAFRGGSYIATISAVLRNDPPVLREVRPDVPRELEKLVARCLRKDPSQRIQLMEDVRIVLEDMQLEPEPAGATGRRRISAKAVALPLIGVALGCVLALSLLSRRQSADLPKFTPFLTEGHDETASAWSPDGKALVYLARVSGLQQVFTKALGSATSTQVTRSLSSCRAPFWNPDGARIYYGMKNALWMVSAAGGDPQKVVDDAIDGSISPDGQTLAFIRGNEDNSSLWLLDTRSGDARRYESDPFPRIFRDNSRALFSPDGSKIAAVLSVQAGGWGNEFWVIPYPSGKPQRVLSDTTIAGPVSGFTWLPDNRNLVFAADLGVGGAGPGTPGGHLYQGDIDTGAVIPFTTGTGQEIEPAASPDGATIALTSGGTDFNIWEVALPDGPLKPELSTARSERSPFWSPTGNQYAYSSNANGPFEIWLRSADGWARPAVPRISGAMSMLFPRISPEGQRLAFQGWGLTHNIWVASIAGGAPVKLDPDSIDHHGASWSPDGNWITYWRFEDRKWSLVKKPVGGGAVVALKRQLAGQLVAETAWSPTGEWIAYNPSDGVHIISPDGKVDKLLAKGGSNFGFSKDGKTLYIVRPHTDSAWEVITIEVRSGVEKRLRLMEVPPNANVSGFSLNRDGTSFLTSVGTSQYDIWLLDRSGRSHGPMEWLRSLASR